MKPRFALYLGFALCLLLWGAAVTWPDSLIGRTPGFDPGSAGSSPAPASTPGQVWRCEEAKGCVAYDTNVDGGPPKKIIFRQGDIVYEATGLTLSTDDGWVRVRRNGGSQ